MVWYQIFVERFANGDKTNDSQPANFADSFNVPANWQLTPWTHDWYAPGAWAQAAGLKHNDNLSLRRYGGDLQGVFDKLDYLQQLGVTALYLNPINDAPSLHKYDARSYHHIDVNFGPDPVGDQKIIAQKNPADPATWRWTADGRETVLAFFNLEPKSVMLPLPAAGRYRNLLDPAQPTGTRRVTLPALSGVVLGKE